ncbi:Succinate dehydrogenase cytochrome B subunit, mitochondrial [Golovinomyces cichoracearum]|uniref:Succinate dehydrogenase cytochrome B subunit, mitochondrial n=1 Tax=Golovinomyces cichoracearum TaxID=62708 RepID=A0A420ITQ5_9PEZI|nr:Succinate dehydrogenase cytochrome B subunit, mitochondrial [Golovinomyces cichoracearum]
MQGELLSEGTDIDSTFSLPPPVDIAQHRPTIFISNSFEFIKTKTVCPPERSKSIVTRNIDSSENHEILVAQRKKRPVAPHLSIYRPQITWYLSALNRITGCAISGGFYVFGAAYLVSPLFNWHLDSVTLATAFGSLPLAAKLGLKTLVAFPFTFHSINGLRHLGWDMGKAFTNQAVIKTGWTVVGLSVFSALALVLVV